MIKAVLRGMISGGLVLVAAGAPATAPKNAARHADPWLDARSVCLFRLGSQRMPRTPQQLSAALVAGWKGALLLPDPARAVTIHGDGYPVIDTLRINLSDGRLRLGGKKDRIHVNDRIEQSLDVAHLEVRAEPLLLREARLHMNLTASEAQLHLERDRRGRPVMMLADAKSGRLTFDVSQADLESMLLHGARESASKYGVTIESTRLKITARTPRSIEASLHISTIIGFIPAGMMFRAKLVVDDAMNARITGLSVEGDEALGPLIVGLLRPALERYNGKTRPLVGFPAGKLQLRDVALRVDESLHLTASFGS